MHFRDRGRVSTLRPLCGYATGDFNLINSPCTPASACQYRGLIMLARLTVNVTELSKL